MNILVGSNKNKIIKAIKEFDPKTTQHNYFGNRNAAKKIVSIVDKI